MNSFLNHPTTQNIVNCPSNVLDEMLVEDCYKPRMHNVYGQFLTDIDADFVLHVRKTPVSLYSIRKEDPELWVAFEKACAHRLNVAPYPDAVVNTLHRCFEGFQLHPQVLHRSREQPPASIEWRALEHGELAAFASGRIEASSHVETTLTQLVQEVTLAAQLRRCHIRMMASSSSNNGETLQGSADTRDDLRGSTEMLGLALARLALGVDYLNAAMNDLKDEGDAGQLIPGIVLFAGRRSSSRRYLILQNWFCKLHLETFVGTSSIMAATLLPQFARQQPPTEANIGKVENGVDNPSFNAGQPALDDPSDTHSLRLVGTLAHEVPMALEALLGETYDVLPSGRRAQVTALLAHLLMLRTNGGLRGATALADTFGTKGFLAAALAAQLPEEFVADMVKLYPQDWASAPACLKDRNTATVFDLIRVWRLDSGDYLEMAGLVRDAWEERWRERKDEDADDVFLPSLRPPQPALMHSNLGSYEEVVEVASLPERVRPAYCCFGTLADGFLPFAWEDNERTITERSQGTGGEGGRDVQTGKPIHMQKEETDALVNSGEAPALHSSRAGDSQKRWGYDAPPALPSPPPGSKALTLASVVMKALQARHVAKGKVANRSFATSAGKLGDDVYCHPISGDKIHVAESKVQVDPRLSPEARKGVLDRLHQLAQGQTLDAREVSSALAAAYKAVTRDKSLCKN